MTFINSFLKTLAVLLAFFVFFILLAIVFNTFKLDETKKLNLSKGNIQNNNNIVVINLNGPIIDDSANLISLKYANFISPKEIEDYLNEIKKINPQVVIFRINSPGGTVGATNRIYNIISEFKKISKTEIIFFTDYLLTSGGYWVSLTGDSVYANYGSIIGSIGVSGPQWVFFNKPLSISTGYLGENINTENGIEFFSQNSGKSKDLFNPFRKPTNDELKHLKNITNNIYNDFTALVSKKRKIELDEIKNEIGALIFDTKLAKEKYLINDTLDFETLLEKIKIKYKFQEVNIYENNIKNNIFTTIFLKSIKDKNQDTFCNNIQSSYSVILPNYLYKC